MKNLGSITLALVALLGLNSCGENKKEEVPVQNDTRMEAAEQAQSDNLDDGAEVGNPEFSNEQLAAVYEDYMEVKSALVNTDAEEAGNAGEQILASLEEAGADENALDAARTIAENEGMHEKRLAFQDLSTAVEEMLAGALASGEIYRQYCPMAFEGSGGTWLSASEEIRNPYYGDKMLKCGTVQDTIK